jgi:hypothetical protein
MKSYIFVLVAFISAFSVSSFASETEYRILLNNGQQLKTYYVITNKKEVSILHENGLIKIPLFAISSLEIYPPNASSDVINSFWYYKTGDPSLKNILTKAVEPATKLSVLPESITYCQQLAAMLNFDQYAQLCNDIFFEHNDINAQKTLFLYYNNKLPEALSYVDHLKENERNDEVLHIKGLILLESGNYSEAYQAWSAAYLLKPKDSYRYMARQAYWLQKNSARYSEEDILKVKLVYPHAIKNSPAFNKLKSTIQQFQEELGLFFAFQPYKKILVVIYPKEQFNQLTGAPAWTKGFTQICIYLAEQDDYSYVIKHELTHSFINQLSFERAPLWFQEGLAQYLSYDHKHSVQHKHFQGFSAVNDSTGMAANTTANQSILYESSLKQVLAIFKNHNELAARYFLTLLRKGEQEAEAAQKAFGP